MLCACLSFFFFTAAGGCGENSPKKPQTQFLLGQFFWGDFGKVVDDPTNFWVYTQIFWGDFGILPEAEFVGDFGGMGPSLNHHVR